MSTAKPRSEPLQPAPLRLQRVNPPGANVGDIGEYWRKYLPKPPRSSQDDGEVAHWIDDVAFTGGAAALGWLRDADSWPKSLGGVMRSRLIYYVNLRYEQLNEQARRDQQQQTREQLERHAEERRRAQAEQGW